MNSVFIREPKPEDEMEFIFAMQRSRSFHKDIHAPVTHEEFLGYIRRYQELDKKSYLVCTQEGKIAGVISLSEIMGDPFQKASVGFYAVADYAGQGYMSRGLNLILEKSFTELKLHRLEASISPANLKSIALVKRSGFYKEGISLRYIKMNGKWHDHERWAITLEDWVEKNEKK
ncbi:MAG: hypothetical protein ACD_46C00429G0002 [uncultured bacterium]|nr:MAG: hypothetical protein ACD_46C00429G0002 [uncultured bacterium]